ncbi:uncharacterized protein M6G45_004798 [Spheniscus humboldti]
MGPPRRAGAAGGRCGAAPPPPRGSWNPQPRTCWRGGGSVSPGGGGSGGGGRGGRRGGGYKSVPPRHMHTSGKLPSRSGGHGRSVRCRQPRSALGRAARRRRAAAAGTPAPICPPREAALAGALAPPAPGSALGGGGGGGRMRVNGSDLNSSVLPRDPPAEGAPRRPPWVTSTLAAILIFTIVVDLLGNLLVILSVYRNKKLRNAVKKAERKSDIAEALEQQDTANFTRTAHMLKLK